MLKHTSPLVWLLLAATLCVDAVAIYWCWKTSLSSNEKLYFGLLCGQINVLCVWTYFAAGRRWWLWPAPVAVSAAVAMLTSGLYSSSNIDDGGITEGTITYLCLWFPNVLFVFALLWVLDQTSFAERWGRPPSAQRWRFAIRHILAITTALALILAILRQAEVVREVPFILAAWVVNNAVLAVAAVMIRSLHWHFVWRLAATFAAAIVLFFIFFSTQRPDIDDALPINLIQAGVLFLWLQFGKIIPLPAADAAADEAPATSPEH